jgi:hypothetical protein
MKVMRSAQNVLCLLPNAPFTMSSMAQHGYGDILMYMPAHYGFIFWG